MVTGHTGFKGAWLCHWLLRLGAHVTGFALAPNTSPNLFDLLDLDSRMDSTFGDLRNYEVVQKTLHAAQPEIVLHLAAQALVRASYDDPLTTFESNVMGTVHLLEAIRSAHALKVCLVATTDKVYRNLEQGVPFCEDDPLGGHDPYSASKAATEIVISSYRHSLFKDASPKLLSARAGNAIGGGDWSADRIIPDAIRAWSNKQTLNVRRPNALRPWQHVLEPLFSYLILCQSAHETHYANYNIGPATDDKMSVGELIQQAQTCFGRGEFEFGTGDKGPHEAGLLQLDASRIKNELGIAPAWSSKEALKRTMAWYKNQDGGANAQELCDRDIEAFEATT